MSATTRPQTESYKLPWNTPRPQPDTTSITIVPVVKADNEHEATSRYVDLYWTPHIGATPIALLRWASHQTRPITMTETDLATAIGAPGVGQVRRTIETLLKHGLATANGPNLHVSITLPTLSLLQVRRFGKVFANRHHHDTRRTAHGSAHANA